MRLSRDSGAKGAVACRFVLWAAWWKRFAPAKQVWIEACIFGDIMLYTVKNPTFRAETLCIQIYIVYRSGIFTEKLWPCELESTMRIVAFASSIAIWQRLPRNPRGLGSGLFSVVVTGDWTRFFFMFFLNRTTTPTLRRCGRTTERDHRQRLRQLEQCWTEVPREIWAFWSYLYFLRCQFLRYF